MDPTARSEFKRKAERTELLLERVEVLTDPEARGTCLEAIQAVLDLHGLALSHLLAMVGPEVAGRLGEDEVVSGLLLLHGLHPRTLEERVARALDSVRPYLASHGGGVEVVALDKNGLRLRLEGSCNGCASSLATLRGTIEAALAEWAPDLPALEVQGAVAPGAAATPAAFVSVGSIGVRSKGLEWQPTPGLHEALEHRSVGGVRVLLCRAEGQDLAYRDRCPGCLASLSGARLDGRLLTCAGCGRSYDVRAAGRCPQDPRLHLEPVPLLAGEAGEVRLQVPAPELARR